MKHLKYFLPAAVVLLGLGFANSALANPFYTGTKARTAVATTTVAVLTPGAATTTPLYDSYEVSGTNQTNGGNLTLPNTVAIVLQGAASSTATVINIACEFSDDNVDWYQNEIYAASTTGAVLISTPVTYSFTYASSTVGGAALTASTNKFYKVFECPVPLRYVRAVITDTGTNAVIWAAIIPKKQRN